MSHNADVLMKRLAELEPEWAGLVRHRSSAAPPGSPCEVPPQQPLSDKSGPWADTLKSLWEEVKVDEYAADKLPAAVADPDPAMVRPENLDDTFKHNRDTLPRGASVTIDRKMVHSVGSVARFKFTPISSSPVKGILGAESHGLIRVSNGNSDPGEAFAAGLALKFPRSRMSSVDMLFGGAFLGDTPAQQQGRAFFDAALRTWLDPIPNVPELRNIRTLFWMFNRMREKTHGCPAFSGLALNVDALFDFTQSGKRTQEKSPAAGILLTATDQTKSAFASAFDAIRDEHLESCSEPPGAEAALAGRTDFRNAFRRLQAGRLELTVHMLPKGSHPDMNAEGHVKLGTLVTTSRFIASPFGDQKLYFRHASGCPHRKALPGGR